MEEQTQQNQTPPATPEAPKENGNDVKDAQAITYLSYIGLLFLVPMLAKKESKFAQFHAKQGLVLTIGWFLGSFLYFLMGLGALVHLFIIIVSIMGLVSVSKGEMKKLPIVGDLAEKFNL
jgi:uncharacterized membrane protein